MISKFWKDSRVGFMLSLIACCGNPHCNWISVTAATQTGLRVPLLLSRQPFGSETNLAQISQKTNLLISGNYFGAIYGLDKCKGRRYHPMILQAASQTGKCWLEHGFRKMWTLQNTESNQNPRILLNSAWNCLGYVILFWSMHKGVGWPISQQWVSACMGWSQINLGAGPKSIKS